MAKDAILLVILTVLTALLLAERAAAALRRRWRRDDADVFYRLSVYDSAEDDEPVDMYYRSRGNALQSFGDLKGSFIGDGIAPEGPDRGFDFSAVDEELFLREWRGSDGAGRKASLRLHAEKFLPEE